MFVKLIIVALVVSFIWICVGVLKCIGVNIKDAISGGNLNQ